VEPADADEIGAAGRHPGNEFTENGGLAKTGCEMAGEFRRRENDGEREDYGCDWIVVIRLPIVRLGERQPHEYQWDKTQDAGGYRWKSCAQLATPGLAAVGMAARPSRLLQR